MDGLRDRSRAPHQCPQRIAAAVAEAICAGRRQHPRWGPGTILRWLKGRHPTMGLPATSTAGDLLARRGLVKKRRRRRHHTHPGLVPATTAGPNDLGTADFKGHVRTGDGVYCYRLTVADQHTRDLLGCQGLLSTQRPGGRPIFDRLFREYGLPGAIRTDNGVPFAPPASPGSRNSMCGGSASAFSISGSCRLIRSRMAPPNGCIARSRRRPPGRPRRIWPPSSGPSIGSAASTPRSGLISSSPAGRPRRCIGRLPGHTPYTGTLPPIEYPGHFIPKRVTNAGTIRFQKRLLFIATSLKQQVLGLEEIADGVWSIYSCRVLLARVDGRDHVLRP